MMTPGKGVVELTDQPARTRKVTYSMWRDAERGDVGLGLGNGWKAKDSKRRDSWDFLDVGTEGSERGGQGDIAASLAGLLGVPIPKNSLGVFLPRLAELWDGGLAVFGWLCWANAMV